MDVGIADLKARMAKYAKAAEQETVTDVESRDVETTEQQQVEPTSSAMAAGEAAERGASASGNAAMVPDNDAGSTAGTSGTGGDSGSLLRTHSDIQQVGRTVGTLPAVVTNLQPTTLVVVERPDQLRDGVGSESEDTESSNTNLDVSNPIHQAFLQRLHDLEVALLNRDPLMRTHLKEIHSNLIQYEEITSLLTTEEIAKIMAAQQVHTNTILVKDVVKKTATATRAKAAKISMDDV